MRVCTRCSPVSELRVKEDGTEYCNWHYENFLLAVIDDPAPAKPVEPEVQQ